MAASAHCTAHGQARTIESRVSFESVPGTEFEMKADLVLLAMGFLGPEKSRLLERPRMCG